MKMDILTIALLGAILTLSIAAVNLIKKNSQKLDKLSDEIKSKK
jgi:hypothetical protein